MFGLHKLYAAEQGVWNGFSDAAPLNFFESITRSGQDHVLGKGLPVLGDGFDDVVCDEVGFFPVAEGVNDVGFVAVSANGGEVFVVVEGGLTEQPIGQVENFLGGAIILGDSGDTSFWDDVGEVVDGVKIGAPEPVESLSVISDAKQVAGIGEVFEQDIL